MASQRALWLGPSSWESLVDLALGGHVRGHVGPGPPAGRERARQVRLVALVAVDVDHVRRRVGGRPAGVAAGEGLSERLEEPAAEVGRDSRRAQVDKGAVAAEGVLEKGEAPGDGGEGDDESPVLLERQE